MADRRLPFVLALAAATALFLVPTPPAGEPGGLPLDKVGHVLVLGALGLLAARAWPGRRAAAYAGLVLYAALVEGAHALLPWRSAEAWDVVAGAVGALATFARR